MKTTTCIKYCVLCTALMYFPMMPYHSLSQIPASGDLELRLRGVIDAMPLEDGDDYTQPSDEQFTTWGGVLDHLLDENYVDAATDAATLDYDLIEFEDDDTDRTYYILENNDSHYWGTYVYYPEHTKDLIVQSPHPQFDFNTGRQGAYVFKQTEAMFFFLAGTHRCNHTEEVDCSGTTTVCGGSSNFKISDLAHNDSTLFHSSTDTLFRRYTDAYFVQLHGFTKGDDDPYVILSNGSHEEPANDFITTFKNQLLTQDGTLTFEIPHENEDWDRLIGRTNTQGRLINGSSDPCDLNATVNSGRFIHMEQEKSKLRANQAGWSIVANAMESVFNMPLPVDLISFEVVEIFPDQVKCKWQTASEMNNAYFEVMRSEDGEKWRSIGRVEGVGNSNTVLAYEFTDLAPLPGTSYYRLNQVDFDGQSESSSIRVHHGKSPEIEILVYPNPTTDQLFIQSSSVFKTIQLRNLSGAEVPHEFQELAEGRYRISLAHLSDGIYFLVLDDQMVRVVKRD